MKINCSKCNSVVEVADTFTGNVISCTSCGGTSMIPMKGIMPGSEIAGYLIEKKLGAGGMGEVWKAKQKTMGRSVALKILPPALTQDPEFVKRFLGEVQMSAMLEHPNIVTAFDAGNDKSIYYLAMSYVEGYTLEGRLEKEGAIPDKEALKIIHGIAEALRYAWDDHKLLHRDIKPANIMIDKHGNPKLMDMGISKSLSEDRALTMTGVAIGTPHYMSPEQARAETDIDFRADLYSLGATLYHVVCGSVPYDSTSMMAILTKHITDPFPWPRDRNPKVSEQCSVLLEIMMAKNKCDRQKSWEDLIRDINLVMQGKNPATKRPPRGQSIIISSVSSGNNSAGPFSAVKNTRFSNKILYAAIAAGIILVGILAIVAVTMSSKSKNVPIPAKTQELVTQEKEHAEAVNTNESAASQADDAKSGKINKVENSSPDTAKTAAPVKMRELTEAVMQDVKKELEKVNGIKDIPFKYNLSEGSIDMRDCLGLKDITPLKGLPLKSLTLGGCREVSDISPLKGMPLVSLYLQFSKVADISVLQGMPLTVISLGGAANLSDIGALRGMKLNTLTLSLTQVKDLSPLKGMSLSGLTLGETSISDINALKGMPLMNLGLYKTNVNDISALKGMPIIVLDLFDCKNLNDLSPLADCKQLKKLSIPEQCRNIDFLRKLPALEILDNKKATWDSKQTPVEFWKVWNAKNAEAQPAANPKAPTEVKLRKIDDKVMNELKSELLKANGLKELPGFSYNLKPKPFLAIGGCNIKDISPLAGLDFDNLDIFNNEIESLEPLAGMQLSALGCSYTKIRKLDPLAGMKMNTLCCASTQIDSVEPLRGLPLKALDISGNPLLKDISPLADCKTLEKLSIPNGLKNIQFLRNLPNLKFLDTKWGSNMRTAEQFWKDWDAANAKNPTSIPIVSGGEYLIVDLSNCELTYSGPIPSDLLINDSYKTDKLVMRRIPAGTFMMGETGKQNNVTLTKDFYIGVFETTQGQYEKVIKANPSFLKDVGKDAPVDTVSWDDCQTFMKELNGRSSTLAFRLPTEAEWEYACRGGKNSKGFEYSGSNNSAEVGWFKEDSGGKTHPVGKKKPNELGLYDMSGNVFEWCSDWYGDYPKELEKDPQGPKSGSKRILRGCCWSNDVVGGGRSRLSVRGQIVPSGRSQELGFRLALSSP